MHYLGGIKNYSLVGVGVDLLEECATGFEVIKVQAKPTGFLFLLLADPDVGLPATSPVACLPVCCHDDNGLNL